MRRAYPFFISLLFIALLSGCGPSTPKFGSAGPVYKPLGADLAALQVPEGEAMTLSCLAGNGQALFGTHWKPMAPVSFTLVEGARTNLTISAKSGGGSMGLQGIFDRNGQKLVFCPIVSGPANKEISCFSIYALDDDFAMGVKRTFDVPQAVMGATLSCATTQDHLPKL